ncbi:restriction endonuclease subunit S [Campylobacter upsaliensis]|nr:restriction endonuclease subunit S [Campylobacter upsaliensis]
MKKHTQSPCERSEISYKPSGIKWLGEIPKHWEICKLNKVSYFINGYAFESSHFDYSFSIPVIRIGDIQNDKIIYHTCLMTKEQENLKNFMIYRGDIVIALSGATTGKFAVCNSNKKAYINQRVAIIRSDIKILKYYLSTFGFVNYIDMLCNGSAQPNISTKEVGNFKIPLPPLQEQKEIAEFLDKKCEKIQNYIDKKQKLITLLQEKKQALINEVVTKGLNPNIEFKNSGIAYLGLIPHHWEVKKLKYVGKVVLGKMLYNEHQKGYSHCYYLKSKNLQWLNVEVSQIEKMWFSEYEKSLYRIKKDDLLVSEGGEVGKTCIWNNELAECYIQNSVHKITLNKFNNAKFFLYLFFTYGKLGVFDSVVSRVSIAHLVLEKLINVDMVVPPLQEQKEIAEFLDKKCEKINSAIEKTKRQIKLIKEYKNTLINEAVCGRVACSRDFSPTAQNDKKKN